MPLENQFRPLTPNDAVDLCHYKEALDHVFSRREIRNIALTGSYGSGKSSVIRSYENIHKERTFIHISLARFEEQGQSVSDSSDRTKIVNILEGKIINQLLHQIPEKGCLLPMLNCKIKSPGAITSWWCLPYWPLLYPGYTFFSFKSGVLQFQI